MKHLITNHRINYVAALKNDGSYVYNHETLPMAYFYTQQRHIIKALYRIVCVELFMYVLACCCP